MGHEAAAERKRMVINLGQLAKCGDLDRDFVDGLQVVAKPLVKAA